MQRHETYCTFGYNILHLSCGKAAVSFQSVHSRTLQHLSLLLDTSPIFLVKGRNLIHIIIFTVFLFAYSVFVAFIFYHHSSSMEHFSIVVFETYRT